MELWTEALSCLKYHWPDLKSAASSDGISSWTPLKPQLSIPCWLSVQWNPVDVDHASTVKKRDHQKFVGVFALSVLLRSGRASMFPLGTRSLRHSCRSSFHCRSPEHQKLWDLLTVMTKFFFLIFSEHPWDKLHTNLPHLQFISNNCVYCSHTDIKLCTYCLYRHTTVLIHEILYLANQLWCSDFLTPPIPLIIPHKLYAFLESLMPLKNHGRKAVWSIPYVSVTFFPSLKHNFIAYDSSKVYSHPDCIFEIHQLWQSGFSRVYSNCCCSCWFEAEILKMVQSSHKMYSNNIGNFKDSTTILNAYTKKSGTYWRQLVYICMHACLYIYIRIYVCVYAYIYVRCVCVYIYIYMCVCIYISIYICVCIYIYICVCVCIYVYIYMCVCVCIYIYIYFFFIIQRVEARAIP